MSKKPSFKVIKFKNKAKMKNKITIKRIFN